MFRAGCTGMSETDRKGLSTLWKAALVALLLAALAVALYIWVKPPPCSFGDYKRAENITLGAQLEGKKLLEATVGLSDAQARDFDSRLQTYAAFYEASCRDERRGVITKEEYNCREGNLRNALLRMESLQTQLEAIAKLTDPGAQRTAAQQALAKFQALPPEPSLATCGPILQVNPQKLDFRGTETNQFVTIANIGYEKLNFSVADLPSGFLPSPPSGTVPAGKHTNVVLVRTNQEVNPSHVLKFEIVDNGGEQVVVTISVDPENAHVYAALAKRAKEAALRLHEPLPTPSDAEAASRLAYLPATPPAVKQMILAQVLEKAGNKEAAKKVFHNAVALSETLHESDFVRIVVGKAHATPIKPQ